MKKIVLSVLVVLTAVIGMAAKQIKVNYTEELKSSKAFIEYNIPNITDGSIMLYQFDKIFCLMPYDIQEKMVLAFREIVCDPRSEFSYAGVKVKHTDTTWEFYYNGAYVIVRGATNSELTGIFRMRDVI